MRRIFLFRLMNFSAVLLLVALLGGSLDLAAAQSAATTEAAESTESDESIDALGRNSPRGAVLGFMAATERFDYLQAAEFLDLRHISAEAAALGDETLAKRLDIVLQRVGWLDVDGLSAEAKGTAGDGLPSYRELLTRVRYDGKEYVLLLQRVPATDGGFVWKVSNATVSRIPELYAAFGYGPVVERLAEIVPETSVFGVRLFKWVVMFIIGILAAPFVVAVNWIAARAMPIQDATTRIRVSRFMTRPVSLLLIAIIMHWSMQWLGVGASTQQIASNWTIITVIATWALLRLTNLCRDAYAANLFGHGRPDVIVLLKPMTSATKIVVVILAFTIWLDNLGVDITTLLAGLGVGGVAIALALQRPMDDFLAALNLFSQKLVKVGDFCRFGDQFGTIEEIGLRTTRLRTIANTMVALPNARFAQEYIENISARRRILFNPTIAIDYKASRAIIEQVLENIRSMLNEQELVDQSGLRVNYRAISTSAHDVEIFAFISTTEWYKYLEVVEDLNLRILDAVEAAGTSLAVSLRSISIDSASED